MRQQGRFAVSCAGALTVAIALGACGGSGDVDDGTAKITLWHGYTGAQTDAINALGKQWNAEHPDQTVTLVFDGGNDDVLQKTTAGFVAGNYPDVAYEYGSSVGPLSRQPRLADLTERSQDPAVDWDDFFPAVKEASTVNGKVVAVPALVDNLALVYNKDLFARAGIAEPTQDWTWQDFRQAASALTDKEAGVYGWSYVNDGTEDTVWRYLAMLWQAGGELLTADNKKPAFNSAAGLAALNQLRDMAITDKSVYLDTGNQNYSNLFADGKIGMLWTGPWDLSSFDKVHYGVVRLPGYNGNHESISGPDLYMMFNRSDRKTDTAWAFTTWLTSPKVHLEYAIQTGDLPLRTSETKLPEYRSTYLKKYPGAKEFTDNLGNVHHARPNIPEYSQVSQAVGEMVQSVLLGQAQPQEALDAATETVQSVLAGS
ncbi:ABC transporter substrate-binding protein [Kineosporia sp. NBRC 101731]|nr:ABC transporter substrate-binding protein [Kineosporia sp. NBRC 101731]